MNSSKLARAARRQSVPLALAALVTLGGCASMDQNIRTVEAKVLPITVGQVAEVSAYDIAAAMRRAGFSSEHILEYGPAVRNALAVSGGAQVRNGDMITALFSVFDEKLYVTSRTRGTFLHELSNVAQGPIALPAG